MKILITGGCGFIGVNLVNHIVNHTKHTPIVLDNMSSGKKEYLSEFDVEIIEGDIRDIDLVKKSTKGVEAVVHLAADTRVIDSIGNPSHNYDVNVFGTFNMLKSALSENIEKFVFASTGGAILGDVDPPVQETIVPNPISPYGAGKLCGEAYCSAFAGSYDMRTVSLRFSNVYGPYSFHKGSVIAVFYRRIVKNQPLSIYGDGLQTRDFIYSEDLCPAILTALDYKKGGSVFQLGTGAETTIKGLIDNIRNITGTNESLVFKYENERKGEVKFNFTDISRAKAELNFSPETELPGGLVKTWRWFREKYG